MRALGSGEPRGREDEMTQGSPVIAGQTNTATDITTINSGTLVSYNLVGRSAGDGAGFFGGERGAYCVGQASFGVQAFSYQSDGVRAYGRRNGVQGVSRSRCQQRLWREQRRGLGHGRADHQRAAGRGSRRQPRLGAGVLGKSASGTGVCGEGGSGSWASATAASASGCWGRATREPAWRRWAAPGSGSMPPASARHCGWRRLCCPERRRPGFTSGAS